MIKMRILSVAVIAALLGGCMDNMSSGEKGAVVGAAVGAGLIGGAVGYLGGTAIGNNR